MNDNSKIELPSGATLTIEDPSGKLQQYFRKLFGNEEAGAEVIASVVRRNKHDQSRR